EVINISSFYVFAQFFNQKRVPTVDSFAEILSIESNYIGHLLASDVDKTQHLTLFHVKCAIAARRNDPLLDDRSGHRMLMQDVDLRWHVIPHRCLCFNCAAQAAKKDKHGKH